MQTLLAILLVLPSTPTQLTLTSSCKHPKRPPRQYMLPANFSFLPQFLLNGNERLMEISSVLYFYDHHTPNLIHSNITIRTIDSGISYTGSIGWRITDPSVQSKTKNWVRPFSGWMKSQFSLSEDWGYHTFIHSFSSMEASSVLYFWDHHTHAPIQIVAKPTEALDTWVSPTWSVEHVRPLCICIYVYIYYMVCPWHDTTPVLFSLDTKFKTWDMNSHNKDGETTHGPVQ